MRRGYRAAQKLRVQLIEETRNFNPRGLAVASCSSPIAFALFPPLMNLKYYRISLPKTAPMAASAWLIVYLPRAKNRVIFAKRSGKEKSI